MGFRIRSSVVLIVAALVLASCAPKMMAATAPPPAEYALQEAPKAPALPTQAPPAVLPEAPTAVVYQTGADMAAGSGQDTTRLIIKSGEIELLVRDTDVAIDRTTQVVGDAGGTSSARASGTRIGMGRTTNMPRSQLAYPSTSSKMPSAG